MSMHQEPENFEGVCRLLALKRHEQPPPGYFHNFSRQVIARLEAGEHTRAAGSALERLFGEAPWVRRIWARFQSQPAFAGLFGVAISGFILFGVIMADRADIPSVARVGDSVTVSDSRSSQFESPLVAATVTPAFPSTTGELMTNQTHSSLFGELRLPVQTASWSIPAAR